MDPNLISATLSTEDIAAINGAIETLNQKLPFLIDLTSDQCRSIPKLGARAIDQRFHFRIIDPAHEKAQRTSE